MLIVATSDFAPPSLPLWSYWNKLKDKHPKLQVSVFVVPFWKGNSDYKINRDDNFQDWYKENKDWVNIVQQGCYNYPNECLKFYKTQKKIIKRGYRKIHKLMPQDFFGFKPPSYRMNNSTIAVLKEIGFSFVVYYNQILFLKPTAKEVPHFEIIETYTNIEDKKNNNINTIFTELDIQLTEFEQIKPYTSFNKLVKEVLS